MCIVVDWPVFLLVAQCIFLVGRVYCCWLAVCIVIGWLCVFLLTALCIVLGCPCVILLFGRMNCCWFSVRNIYWFAVCIVVDSPCVFVNRWLCLFLLVVLFIVYLLDVCISVGWPCIFLKVGGMYCCYLAVLIVVGCVYCVVWAANCLMAGWIVVWLCVLLLVVLRNVVGLPCVLLFVGHMYCCCFAGVFLNVCLCVLFFFGLRIVVVWSSVFVG